MSGSLVSASCEQRHVDLQMAASNTSTEVLHIPFPCYAGNYQVITIVKLHDTIGTNRKRMIDETQVGIEFDVATASLHAVRKEFLHHALFV